MKKLFICVLLVTCLVFQSTAITLAESNLQLVGSQFAVTIQSDIRMKDLSGIKLNVYSAQKSHCQGKFSEYSETFAFTVTTDQTGTAVFQRPSAAFSVTVRTDSLPDGFGVDQQTRFFLPNVKNFTLRLAEIDSVDVSFEDGNAVPLLYDKNGNALSVDAEATLLSSAENKRLYTVNESARAISYSVPVRVTAGESIYSITKTYSCSYENELEKAGYLYDLGFINEDQYMDNVCQVILGKKGQNDTPSQIDATTLYATLRDYCERKSSELSETDNASLALQFLTNRNTTRWDYALLSDSGRFRLHYDNSIATYGVAESILAEFEAIDSLFCQTEGFWRPYTTDSSAPFEIHLVEMNTISAGSHYALAQTVPNGTNGSLIKISYELANLIFDNGGNFTETPEYRGYLAHEYMHAILYRYGITYDSIYPAWFHECYSGWAGIAYDSNHAALIKNQINDFLNSSTKPLYHFSNSEHPYRRLGSCIFPLYVEQAGGGMIALRKVLDFYSSFDSPLEALNAGLQYYGTGLGETFAGFSAFNYAPTYFYEDAATGWYHTIGDTINANAYPVSVNMDYTIPRLASRHTKFVSPNTVSPYLTITLDFTGTTDNASPAVKYIEEYDDGYKDIYTRHVSGNRLTIVYEEFGDEYSASVGLVVCNTANEGTVTYTRSAVLS